MNASETDISPHYTSKKTAWKQKLESKKPIFRVFFCKDNSGLQRSSLWWKHSGASLKNFSTARWKLSKQSGTSQVVAAISFLTCPMVKAEYQRPSSGGGKKWIWEGRCNV